MIQVAGLLFLNQLPHFREQARSMIRAQDLVPAEAVVSPAQLAEPVNQPVSS